MYQSDDGYVKVSAISIASVLENNKNLTVNIYYVGYNLSDDSRQRLTELVSRYFNATLVFIDAAEYETKLEALPAARKRPRGGYATWYKLFAFDHESITGDRILYLDGHTIICGSLEPLLDIDFSGKTFAASYNGVYNEPRIDGVTMTELYNVGTLLVNLDKWRNENLVKRVERELSVSHDYVVGDQDYLNASFKGDWVPLGIEWNYQSDFYAYPPKHKNRINEQIMPGSTYYSEAEILENWFEPKIVHSCFGLLGKPWDQKNLHPNRHLWGKYMKLIPWKPEEFGTTKLTLNGWLYRILPMPLFMPLYAIGARRVIGQLRKQAIAESGQ